MLIKNALVYTDSHTFEKGSIFIDNGRIQKIPGNINGQEQIDADGLMAIPGLVDIHLHGAAGYDFCNTDIEGFNKIAGYEAENGILAICMATMAYREEKLADIMDMVAGYKGGYGADLIGINMEGPFINPGKTGAQNPEYLMLPDKEMFMRLQKRSGGIIKFIDLAPELPGAEEFIKDCSRDVNISLAHTMCSYDTAMSAFLNGARHVTHLYNAMPGINHRNPGPVVAAAESGAEVELITDNIHIHPAMVRFTFRMSGADNVIFISDSMEATGLPDGEYMLGGQEVLVNGGRAVLKQNPDIIAGSTTNLFDCMKTAVLQMGIPAGQAVQAATQNPAKAAGVEKDYGSLSEGHYGNVILIDKEFNIHRVIQKGKVLK